MQVGLLRLRKSRPCQCSLLNLRLACRREKGVILMELNTKRMRCPECLNYMTFTVNDKGSMLGTCTVCHCKVSSRQHSPKEKRIRIYRP